MTLAVVSLGLAFGASPAEVVDSAAPFRGAVESISSITTIAYLPGYWLNVNGRDPGDFDAEAILAQLRGIVTDLASLVRGLEQGKVVSVVLFGRPWTGDHKRIVVTMVLGDPASLKVFVNGRQLVQERQRGPARDPQWPHVR